MNAIEVAFKEVVDVSMGFQGISRRLGKWRCSGGKTVDGFE